MVGVSERKGYNMNGGSEKKALGFLETLVPLEIKEERLSVYYTFSNSL